MRFIWVFGAGLAAAGPIQQLSEHAVEGASNAARDAGGQAAGVSSVAPPALQTGTPTEEPNQKFAAKVGDVSPSGSALKTGWVPPTSQAFIDICLYHHNVHRANHSAPNVVWNNQLATWAQGKAQKCKWDESTPKAWGTVGINIAGGTYGSNKVRPNPSGMISGLWYNSEMMNYPGYGNPNPPMKNFENWGHFSQVVWPGSRQIGCGLADCQTKWFGLCLYKPAGNWLGEFDSIKAPRGDPIVYPNGQTSM